MFGEVSLRSHPDFLGIIDPSTAFLSGGSDEIFFDPNLGPPCSSMPCTVGTRLPGGTALIRSIAVLVTAMGLSRPGIPAPEAKRYATALNEIAAANHIDPLLAVAMIHYETHWYPQLVSSDGEDHGLGQIRARFIGACRQDEDPLLAPSAECIQVKLSLLDGVENIKRMGSVIRANMDFCRKLVGKMKTEHWLAGYQGYVDPIRHTYCAPGPKTTRVIEYYDGLVEKFYPKPKPKPKAKPKVEKNVKSAAPAKTAPANSPIGAPAKVGPTTPATSKAENQTIAKSSSSAKKEKKQRAEKPRTMPGASRKTRGGQGTPPRSTGTNKGNRGH